MRSTTVTPWSKKATAAAMTPSSGPKTTRAVIACSPRLAVGGDADSDRVGRGRVGGDGGSRAVVMVGIGVTSLRVCGRERTFGPAGHWPRCPGRSRLARAVVGVRDGMVPTELDEALVE